MKVAEKYRLFYKQYKENWKKEKYEQRNYPIKTGLFKISIGILCFYSMMTGFSLTMIYKSLEMKYYFLTIAMIIGTVVLISIIYFIYTEQRNIMKAYEDAYGSSLQGDLLCEREKRKVGDAQ